ncbi:hypothetical protein D9758_018964 [Tetrapyrgos nigripes]|uniref:MYND-type domain-containing protein n=1 Tax=Tetrapyrgos nigripes TaxID=182062 RepID=A0A8H5B8L2_9AGAR|nr:hypothetical protein D9758_018964 [Tetrapyrgos nigripes]
MDPSTIEGRMPPMTASILQACHSCFKGDTRGSPLSRCSRCHSVAYCGSACQKVCRTSAGSSCALIRVHGLIDQADWSRHKQVCKGLVALTQDPIYKSTVQFSLSDVVSTDREFVNKLCEQNLQNECQFLSMAMGRPLGELERNLLGWQAKCYGCSRTDRIIRLENSPQRHLLKPCQDCRFAFYCCSEHWDRVKQFHTQPDPAGYGLSQCEMNQQFRVDLSFSYSMSGVKGREGPWIWVPDRIKEKWEPLGDYDGCWEDELEGEVEVFLRLRPASLGEIPESLPGLTLRLSTEGLSIPMTILYSLQKLYGEDLDGKGWSRKETLNIHVLGASETELMMSQMFEEILHRLPAVKTLNILLVGPGLSTFGRADRSPKQMQMCPKCSTLNRKRFHDHQPFAYHDYVRNQGSKFTKPDLAIAFNSASTVMDVSSWSTTKALLIEEKISSVFTSYNREEAFAEAEVLRKMGAKLVEGLGPVRNPWGALNIKPEPEKLNGWYGESMWLCGGFK